MMKSYLIITFVLGVIAISIIPISYAQSLSISPTSNSTSTATLENGVWHTKINKQIQIAADIVNNQDKPQTFAYLVQIQNQDGVVISLSWLTGSLDAKQTLSPSQSWVPTLPGMYTVQIFIWQAIDNPDALSPPLTMKIEAT